MSEESWSTIPVQFLPKWDIETAAPMDWYRTQAMYSMGIQDMRGFSERRTAPEAEMRQHLLAQAHLDLVRERFQKPLEDIAARVYADMDSAYLCYRYLPEAPGAMDWVDDEEFGTDSIADIVKSTIEDLHAQIWQKWFDAGMAVYVGIIWGLILWTVFVQ